MSFLFLKSACQKGLELYIMRYGNEEKGKMRKANKNSIIG